jgi:hypothetical protein
MELMFNAIQESKNPVSQNYRGPFERTAYIDGVAYLLRGLPQDLDETEASMIRRSMPASLADSFPQSVEGVRLPNSRHAGDRTLLHKAMQLFVARAIIWFSFLWPYILLLLGKAAKYERKYKVCENLVGQGVELANVLGRQSVSMSVAVYNLGDGKVGQLLMDSLAWTVQSMAGGFSDGVEEGWSKVGSARRQ